LSFVSFFVLFLFTHNRRGGGQNFLGPRGVKCLNTGLVVSVVR
jgi:hypothetical protein